MNHRNRSRAVWIGSGILGALAALLIGLPAWFRSLEARRWEDLGRRIVALELRVQAQETPRILLRGTPVPGNAWDDYGGLLGSMGENRLYSKTIDFATRLECTDKEEVRTLLAEHPTLAGGLRRGAQKANCRAPAGFWKDFPLWSKTASLIGLSIAQALFWQEEDRLLESEDLLVDASQVALDLTRAPDSVGRYQGLYWIQAILQGMARLAQDPRLPPESLKELSQILETLDQSLPTQASSWSSLVEMGRELQAAGSVDHYLEGVLRGMKVVEGDFSLVWYGYSDRLALADAFDQAYQWTQEDIEGRLRPWPEVRDAKIRTLKGYSKSHNPILRMTTSIQLKLSSGIPDDPIRQARARIRLVQAALGFCRTGVVPDLEDPFGTKIRWSRSGDRLTLWSLGKDGVDDGGLGDWRNSLAKGDIVLTLHR